MIKVSVRFSTNLMGCPDSFAYLNHLRWISTFDKYEWSLCSVILHCRLFRGKNLEHCSELAVLFVVLDSLVIARAEKMKILFASTRTSLITYYVAAQNVYVLLPPAQPETCRGRQEKEGSCEAETSQVQQERSQNQQQRSAKAHQRSFDAGPQSSVREAASDSIR